MKNNNKTINDFLNSINNKLSMRLANDFYADLETSDDDFRKSLKDSFKKMVLVHRNGGGNGEIYRLFIIQIESIMNHHIGKHLQDYMEYAKLNEVIDLTAKNRKSYKRDVSKIFEYGDLKTSLNLSFKDKFFLFCHLFDMSKDYLDINNCYEIRNAVSHGYQEPSICYSLKFNYHVDKKLKLDEEKVLRNCLIWLLNFKTILNQSVPLEKNNTWVIPMEDYAEMKELMESEYSQFIDPETLADIQNIMQEEYILPEDFAELQDIVAKENNQDISPEDLAELQDIVAKENNQHIVTEDLYEIQDITAKEFSGFIESDDLQELVNVTDSINHVTSYNRYLDSKDLNKIEEILKQIVDSSMNSRDLQGLQEIISKIS